MLDPKQMVFTSPQNPILELQSKDDAQNYLAKIAELNHQELCIELSNVMAAKHNKMVVPSDLGNYIEKQAIVTELTDKATLICFVYFGQSFILEYWGQDLREFNKFVNDVDEKVAQLDIDGQLNMQPDQHGNNMLEALAFKMNHPLKKDMRADAPGEDGYYGERNGNGSYTYENGEIYDGEWKDGKYNGQGTYSYANGEIYDGEWKDGMWNGKGRYCFENGNVYVGDFRDYRMHGQGVFTTPDGANYVGGLKEGKFHGQGALTYVDGSKDIGKWEDGVYIG